jgi:phosphatidylglycerol:prolipoprotein diacylglycerol transferase
VHPVLFTIPLFGRELDIPTYGVLLALGFLIILKTASSLARRKGIASHDVIDLAFTVFLAGLVGAKMLLVLLDLPYYAAHPSEILGVIRSAGVFYGGLLLAVPTCIWFARRRRLPLWKVADIAGVCLPIGLAVGRLGCFAAGCCYGAPADVGWAVTFTSETAHQTVGVPLHVPLHPSQIYLSLNAAILLAILLWRHRHKQYDGQVFLWFVVLYGATRSFWELFRGDAVRGFLIPDLLSTSQAIGIASVIVALFVIAHRRRTSRPT